MHFPDSIRTMRIPYPGPKKAFMRLDLTSAVKGKQVDVTRNLALCACNLHQQKQLIALLHHIEQRHLFCHLGRRPAFCMVGCQRDVVIARGAGEREVLGKDNSQRVPVFGLIACIIGFDRLLFLSVLSIGVSDHRACQEGDITGAICFNFFIY
jgi:hypothetical protein